MKHIKSYNEELDYLDSLRLQTKAREDFERRKGEEGHSGNHLSKLETDRRIKITTDQIIEERRILADRVIQGILASERGKSNFKNKLIELLEENGF